jgi:two-component system, LytTR family, sensor kinase
MRKYLKTIVVVIAAWTFLALLFTPQTFMLNTNSMRPLTWFEALAFNLVIFYLWALLTPFVWLLGKWFPLENKEKQFNFINLFILGFPIALFHLVLLQQANFILSNWSGIYIRDIPMLTLLIGMGAANIMFYWLIIIIGQANIFFRRYHDREQSLTQAQLQALKTQLHPHFLFNTLNAISQLLYENEAEAEKTISQLSDLLRVSLKSEQAQEVTLFEELDFLKMYLDIQQILLQNRLKVIWRILPQTLDAYIPNMILQPLVENSIRHGIAPRVSGGTIKIIATREDNWLTLRICDDGLGLGFHPKQTKQFGIGLSNTKKRLYHLYGEDYQFQLMAATEGSGTIVFLKIPFRKFDKEKIYENSHFDSGRYGVGTSAHLSLFEK